MQRCRCSRGPAEDLAVGDIVSGVDGDLTVTRLSHYDEDLTVYNLEVEGAHTYFVGDLGAWVHNCKFLEGNALLKRFQVSKETWHRRTKPDILKQHADEVAKTGAKNPDIGITDDGNIAFRNTQTGVTVETTTPASLYFGE